MLTHGTAVRPAIAYTNRKYGHRHEWHWYRDVQIHQHKDGPSKVGNRNAAKRDKVISGKIRE